MQVEQYGEEYQTQSWGPLVALVRDNRPPAGRGITSSKDRGAIKELFLTLNGYIQVSLNLFQSAAEVGVSHSAEQG